MCLLRLPFVLTTQTRSGALCTLGTLTTQAYAEHLWVKYEFLRGIF